MLFLWIVLYLRVELQCVSVLELLRCADEKTLATVCIVIIKMMSHKRGEK